MAQRAVDDYKPDTEEELRKIDLLPCSTLHSLKERGDMSDEPELLFERHPAPWSIKYDADRCGNGGRIDHIVDANGASVATTYVDRGVFDALWEMYEALTPEQIKAMGPQHKHMIVAVGLAGYPTKFYIDVEPEEAESRWRRMYDESKMPKAVKFKIVDEIDGDQLYYSVD